MRIEIKIIYLDMYSLMIVIIENLFIIIDKLNKSNKEVV